MSRAFHQRADELSRDLASACPNKNSISIAGVISAMTCFAWESKLGIKKLELAFDGLERQAAGMGERPTERALKPFGAMALHTIGDLGNADDAAGVE